MVEGKPRNQMMTWMNEIRYLISMLDMQYQINIRKYPSAQPHPMANPDRFPKSVKLRINYAFFLIERLGPSEFKKALDNYIDDSLLIQIL